MNRLLFDLIEKESHAQIDENDDTLTEIIYTIDSIILQLSTLNEHHKKALPEVLDKAHSLEVVLTDSLHAATIPMALKEKTQTLLQLVKSIKSSLTLLLNLKG